jgi:hypothetical protein
MDGQTLFYMITAEGNVTCIGETAESASIAKSIDNLLGFDIQGVVVDMPAASTGNGYDALRELVAALECADDVSHLTDVAIQENLLDSKDEEWARQGYELIDDCVSELLYELRKGIME